MVEDMATNLMPALPHAGKVHSKRSKLSQPNCVCTCVSERDGGSKSKRNGIYKPGDLFRDQRLSGYAGQILLFTHCCNACVRACVKASLLRSPTRRTQERCASTPEGERDHLRTPSKTRFQKVEFYSQMMNISS